MRQQEATRQAIEEDVGDTEEACEHARVQQLGNNVYIFLQVIGRWLAPHLRGGWGWLEVIGLKPYSSKADVLHYYRSSRNLQKSGAGNFLILNRDKGIASRM